MGTGMLRDNRQIPFEIEKEVWNRYELADSAELRIRAIIVKILHMTNENDSTKVDVAGEFTIITNIVPMDGFNLFGKPNYRIYTPEEIKNARSVEVDYKTIIEDWNHYRLEDGRKFKTKLVLASVKRLLDMYDQHGMPIYNTNSTTVVNIEPIKKP